MALPDGYLARGYLTFGGALRPELSGAGAMQVATHLRGGDLAPQELAFTLEALRLLLPDDTGTEDARQHLPDTMRTALTTVRRTIQQPNNPGLVAWLAHCTARVTRPAEIPALLAHMQAVTRQYGALVAVLAMQQG